MRWTGSHAAPPDAERVSGRMLAPRAADLLRLVYAGRVMVAIVVFVAAAFYFRAQPPGVILALAIGAIASVVVSALSIWHTHIRRATPGPTFLYAQALFDLALVTTIVHVTGGIEDFSALYILVIAVSAVLMPVASSLLITLLACMLYVGDIIFWQPIQLLLAVWLQLGIFITVAIATGWLASRVRVVGAEHEVLQKEVRRLRLEAGDILRHIKSGIVTVDGDGNLAYANPAAEELLGLSTPSHGSTRFLEVLKGRAPELWAAIVATQRHGQRTIRGEGRISANGTSFPIGLTTTAIEVEPGQNPSVTAIFTNISDQKQLEELHLRTERLEAVAELSASLAHEIKNPLASIRSSVEQLSRSPQRNDDERLLAKLVVRESDRLSRLLSEFLDFARVRVTSARSLDLLAVARGAIDVVRKHPDCPASAGLVAVGEGARIEGDEDLLHRVVVNLVLNAVQAAGAAAKVRVEVRPARPDELPYGVAIDEPALLRVIDNGPGIDATLRERLFTPFVSGRKGGSGLGLAIVHRAVQAHRGLVLCDSDPGRGTRFTVLLPCRTGSEATAA